MVVVDPALMIRLKKKNYSEDFKILLENINEPCDLKTPSTEPPDWLDKSMFKEGLAFIWERYFAIQFCSLLHLIIAMAFPSFW